MKRAREFAVEALASCFFLTYPLQTWATKRGARQTGGGLIGTLAGFATAPLLPHSLFPCVLFLTGSLFISVAISDAAEDILGTKDDQRIVIDEWVGYLASVAFLHPSLRIWMAGVVLFRVVDMWKPLGINRFAQLPGGWGIVMDDVAGGVLVNAILRLLPLS